MRETGEENRGTTENILPRREVDKSQKVALLVKNLQTQRWEDEEGKLNKRSINKKPPKWWGGQERKPKDHKV